MTGMTGKAVVITGAGSGIGRAYARFLAALGCSVVVNDIKADSANQTVEEIRAGGGDAVAKQGDVSQWAFAEDLIDNCMDSFGTITGFVSNAGILRPARLDDASEAEFRRMMEVNFLGTAACAQAAAKRLRQIGNGGSIVNVASGSQSGDIGLGGYGASKAAIAALTYSWAMELRDTGIRINAVSPLADTDMAKQNSDLLEEQGQNREVRYFTLPAPEVNAPLIAFLLSDASGQINGQVIRIAGRQLSFVTHPKIAAPVLENDWTFEKIVRAFDETLADQQVKLGLSFA